MRANLGAAIVGASLTLTPAAQAQSVWGAGATNTTNYNLDSNWGPATKPVTAGQSAVFKNNGKINVNVTAGPISPDSWTFNANSKSFSISGADVNFSLAGANGGIINKANTGQTITIGNNIGEASAGVRVRQTGNSTLILSGANTYTGGTVILGGAIQATNNSSFGTGLITLGAGTLMGLHNINIGNAIDLIAATSTVDNLGKKLTLSGDITGNGVLNLIDSSGSFLAFSTLGRTVLSGNNSYTGGTNVVGTIVQANNNAAFGTGDVALDFAQVQTKGTNLTLGNNFVLNSTINSSGFSGAFFDANGATLRLTGNISGTGMLETIDSTGGFNLVILTGTNSYTGGTFICSCSTLQIGSVSTLGSIIGNVTNEGQLVFSNSDTSGITTIDNAGGLAGITFRNSTDAGTMTINNKFDPFFGPSTLDFRQDASAANATINNDPISQVTFHNTSTAGNATINNNFDPSFGPGVVAFLANSNAGTATINNFGLLAFSDHSSAQNATITNSGVGALQFNNHASADNATIVNSSAYGMDFFDQSTSGNAFITTKNNSGTFFSNRSDGGTARFETEAGSIVDFSHSRGPNADGKINAGSIAGAGSYYIGGGNTLVVGGNNLSTEVSGVIADNNPCGCTTGPGALEKVGTGTLILSGTNTYTGGTTISAGKLSVAADANLGAPTGALTFNGGTLQFTNAAALTLSNARTITLQSGGGGFEVTSGDVVINQSVGGSGALTKSGAGFLILAGDNTYAGGTTISAGTLQVGNGGTSGSITGNVVNNGLLAFNRSNNSAFDGQISGSGALTKSGAGTLTLTADHTYTGTTTIAAGTLQLGNGGTTGTVASDMVNNGGALVFNRSNTLAFGAKISGAGSVTQLGTGTTVLTGATTYTGGTTISAGTLQVGNGGTTGSITGNVVDNGVLAFNRSNDSAFDGQISGSGALTKSAAGTLTLTADSTYAGNTTIAAGTLQLGNGGTTGTVASGVVNNGGTLAFNRSNTLTFGAQISGAGSVTQLGTGTTVLTGANTFTGGTTVAGGNLRVNGSVVGAVTVQSGGTLSGIGSVAGPVTVQSGGTLSAGQSPGTFTVGALNLSAGSTSVFELGSPGVVGGPGNDLVNVTGTLTLGGTLSVNAPSAGYYRLFNYGTLTPSGFDAITGSSNGTPTVLTNVPNQVNLSIAAAGQRIQFWDGTDQTGNGVVNGGTGTWNAANTNWTGAPGQATFNDQWRSSVGVFAGTAGTVTVAGGQAFDTLQFSTTGYVLNAGPGGQLQLAGLSGTGTINTDSGVVATINAPIVNGSSQGLTKVGGGTLILTGANTYSGGTNISGGTLQLGNGGTTGSIIGNVTDNSIFAIKRSDTVTFAGTISGSGAFQQLGTGTTILTADNNYSGGTTISAGTLQLGNGGTTGSIAGNVLNDGRLTYNRNNTFDFSGAISGSGSLQVTGGFLGLTGANTFSGGTTIVSGVLAIGSLSNGGLNGGTAGSLSGNVDVGGASGNTLNQLWFTRTDNTTFAGDITGSGLVAKFGPEVLTLTGTNAVGGTVIWDGVLQIGNGGTSGSLGGGVSFLGTTSTLRFNRSDTLLFGGFIGSGGFIEQAGSGTTILTGTVLGSPIKISAGTLQVGNGGTTGSLGTGAVTDNSILAFNRSDALTVTNAISGTGALRQIGSGTTILTADNNYSGGTTISSGTLQLGSGGTTGSIVGDVVNNSVLAVNRSNAVVLGGVISGTGTFQQLGGGITTLSGANTYTGLTTVTAGTLTIAAGASITSNVANSATFNNSGSVAGNVTNFGTFNNNAGGTVSGLLSNSFGVVTNGGELNGGATLTLGTVTNNNLILGAVTIVNGNVNNNAAITGTVTNSASFHNNSNGTVSGLFTGTAGFNQNTGQLNGGVSMTGGTLDTSGTIRNGLTNAATVNVFGGAVNGAIANNAGGAFNVGGTVTSDSTFTNASGAMLAVGTSGAYTLQGLLANSGVVTIASGGQLIATVGGIVNNAGGSITVALGGTVKDDLNNSGAITNNGAYLANVASNSGPGSIINAASWTGNVLSNSAFIANNGGWTGNVASNTGIINNNLTWTGTVSNAGSFNNNTGATVSGLLTNTAGLTLNNGALNGGATVSGGTFAGAGTVTNLSVSGGIFSPGNGAPGSSMTVTGNLAFQSGAMYVVQLNPSTSTFAAVGGTASLNGSAGAAFLAGNYVAKQYTILAATGGVSGAFSSFTTLGIPSSFKASLSYDVHDVFLNLALNFVPPPGSGLNANQQRAANAIVGFFNATGGIPLVFGGLTPAGLTQVSGELATRTQQTSFEAMNLFLGLLTDPFVAGRGEGAAPLTGASQFAESDEANAYTANGNARSKSEREAYAAVYRKASIRDTYDPRWRVWAAGYGGSQVTDGNAVLGSNNARSSIGGVAVGADYRFSPNTLAGFAVSGGGTGFSVVNSGTGRSDLFQAGAFVRHTNGPAYISAALAYGWQGVTTDRTVTVAGSDLLRANFNANTLSGRAEGGYRFVAPWVGGVGITPYAAGQFTTIDLPAYAEQAIAGANTFALTYASKSATDTRSELGVRSDKSYPMQNGVFTLRGRAAWAHDFNPDRNIAATFQTLPGASFVVNGAAQARDAALVTGSAEMKWLNGLSLAATFEGEFSNVTRSYAGKGVVRYAW